MDLTHLFSVRELIGLLTLIVLEIILGIDNIVFIAITSDRLPEKEASKARKLGLLLAIAIRIFFVSIVAWIVKLERPLFEIMNHPITGKGIIMVLGGLYLLVRSTLEIYKKVEGVEEEASKAIEKKSIGFWNVILNILFIDLIFSIESIITAVGLVGNVLIIALAIVISVAVMIIYVDAVSRFILKHSSLKILALSFLVLIGVLLLAEGTGFHFPRGYVYFAMAFSFVVQMLNIRYEEKKRLLTHQEV
ncbi:MAG: TerC family protein [Actinobacteria bacterium]|nr:TerC family protein [Actinomycetota bacterium]